MRVFQSLSASLLCFLLATASPSTIWASPDGSALGIANKAVRQVPNPNAPVISTTILQDFGATGSNRAAAAEDSGACGPMDVAFVVDTTGSMGGALSSVDAELAGLLSAIQTASGNDYRLALVTFKDNVTINEGFRLRNRASIAAKILSLSPDGGNNTPEASDRALSAVVNGFAYRPDALKIAVLVTDAPPGGFDDQFTPGVDDVAARLVAQQAAAKSIKVSSIFVPTNGLDSSIVGIMQTYARLSSGFYTQTASNGMGTGAGIQQVIAHCGGNLVFIQPSDGQELQELPPSFRGRATPNEGETFSRVNITIQRDKDGLFWNGRDWVNRIVSLPTRLSGTDWTAPDGTYKLPIGEKLLSGKYTLSAFAYDARGRQRKSTSIAITIKPESQLTLLDNNPNQKQAERDGAVADGATQILVKFTTNGPGAVTFSKQGEATGDILTQSDGDGQPINIPAHVERGKYVAYALYTVPKQLPRVHGSVKFQVEFVPEDGGSATADDELELRRPPVALVHGLWGNPDTWRCAGPYQALLSAGYDNNDIFLVDYSNNAAGTFESNVGEVRLAVETLLSRLRARRIAVSQVDIVGHSMGGILARLFVQSATRAHNYKTSDNFNKGSVHRLVTLGTPHFGSSLANLAVLARSLPSFVTGALSRSNHPLGPALDDLSVGSRKLVAIDTTSIRSFAAVGNVSARGFVADGVVHVFYQVTKVFGGRFDGLDLSTEETFLRAVFNAEDTDLVVAGDSQRGGLSGQFIRAHTPVAHIQIGGCSIGLQGETTSGSVGATVVRVLGSADNQLAPAFPSVTPANFAPILFRLLPLRATASRATTDTTLIEGLPENGTIFAPSQTITFNAMPVAGANVTAVLFIVGRDNAFDSALDESAPFSATFTIPDDFVGNYPVTVMARDAAGNMQIVERNYTVRSTSTPQSLSINPISFTLTSQNQTQQLNVTGSFAGGTMIDLTDAASGTTYSSSDSAIATVTRDGIVTAKNSGVVLVTATNGGQSVQALVTVRFNVPIVTAVTPQTLPPGARSLTLHLIGSDFGGVASVEFLRDGQPDSDITVGTPQVDDSGTEITVTLSVSNSAPAGKRVVVVTTPGGRSAEQIGEGNALTVELSRADLSVAISSVPGPATVGANLMYTVTTSNIGPGAASDVRLANTLPSNVQFVRASSTQGNCIRSGSSIVCEIGTLASGSSAVVTIIVRPTQAGAIADTATVTGSTTDPNMSNNTATCNVTATLPIAENVTAKVRVTRGELHLVGGYTGGIYGGNRRRRFRQTITLENTEGVAIGGPVSLVFDGLSKGASVNGTQSVTARAEPSNSPYASVPIGTDNVLRAGEHVTIMLEFTATSDTRSIIYSTRVLAGSGDR